MFLKTLAILIFALPLAAQAQTVTGLYVPIAGQTGTITTLTGVLARPTLNGLELRKGHMIQQAQVQAQAELDQANKALTQTQAMKISPGTAERTVEQQNQAKARQKQAQLRVTQLQAQMADWEQTTLTVHAADSAKYKVDWSTGQIVGK